MYGKLSIRRISFFYIPNSRRVETFLPTFMAICRPTLWIRIEEEWTARSSFFFPFPLRSLLYIKTASGIFRTKILSKQESYEIYRN